MVLKARASTKPKKTFRRKTTRGGRVKKRWNVGTTGSLFGYKWNARLGTRAIVNTVHKMRDNLHQCVNVQFKALTKGTIYTLAPMAGIVKTTIGGDQDGFRTDTNVYAKYIHAKLNFIPTYDNIDASLYVKLVRCEIDNYAYVQGGSYNCWNYWFTHLGWTDLFYNASTAPTACALPFSKRVQTLWQKDIKYTPMSSDATTQLTHEKNLDLFVKLNQEFAYKTDATAGHEGKKYQYFFVIIADSPVGTNGTTQIGKLNCSYDLVYQNF